MSVICMQDESSSLPIPFCYLSIYLKSHRKEDSCPQVLSMLPTWTHRCLSSGFLCSLKSKFNLPSQTSVMKLSCCYSSLDHSINNNGYIFMIENIQIPKYLHVPLLLLCTTSFHNLQVISCYEKSGTERWEKRIRSEKALLSSHRCFPCVQLASMKSCRMQAVTFQATSVKVQTQAVVLFPSLGKTGLQHPYSA